MNIPKARWYRIGLLLFLIYVTAFLDRSNISMAAPYLVKELHLSGTVTGILLSFFFWGYAITQVPGGWVAGKVSPKTLIVWAMIVWGIFAILTGVVTSYGALLTLRFVMGLAEGVVWPSFMVMYVHWYPDNERAKATNFSEMAMPFANLIMAPLSGWMIATWDYHVMFILQGLPPIILSILFAIFAADTPAKDRFLSSEERTYLEQNRSTTEKETGSLNEVLLNPRVWLFGTIYFLWCAGLYGFSLWVPSIIKQLSHQGAQGIGWLSALPYLLALAGMYVNSVWSDRHGINRAWFVAVPLLLAGVALFVERFIGSSLIINMIFMMLAGIGLYSAFGPWWAWAVTFVPRNQSGGAMGLINVCGSIGGIVGPILVAAVASGPNLLNGFYALGICLFLAFLLTALVARKFTVRLVNTSDRFGSKTTF